MTEDIQKLRARLAEIHNAWHRELANIPVTAIWGELVRVIVALTYSSSERGLDALERLTDDMVKHVAAARRQLRATDRWLAAEAKKEAARKAAVAAVKPPLRAAG